MKGLELQALLTSATCALSRLDFEGLEELSVRALALQRCGPVQVSCVDMKELSSRLRVFAAAMQATRANLEFSQAANMGGPGAGASGLRRLPWAR